MPRFFVFTAGKTVADAIDASNRFGGELSKIVFDSNYAVADFYGIAEVTDTDAWKADSKGE